jgi:hypothetical protein
VSNKKNRKFVVTNPNRKPERILEPPYGAAVATIKSPPAKVKQAFLYETKTLDPKIVRHYRYITYEIKRSLVCGAITLSALIILYFIFK